MAKRIILLGAGHAHVQVLRQWIRQRFRPNECWLISDCDMQMYSGMVPGWLAGDYSAEDCVVHVAPLCRAAGVGWVQAQVTALRADAQAVTAGGEGWDFDLLSINLGARQALGNTADNWVAIKPFENFVSAITQLDNTAALLPSEQGVSVDVATVQIAVVGAGLGGFELVLGLAARYRDASNPVEIAWYTGNRGPLPQLYPSARKRALAALEPWPVTLLPELFPTDGPELEQLKSFQCVVWATGGKPPAWLDTSGLTLDEAGFILVDEFCSSLNYPNIVAAGDICRRIDGSLLPSGVNAVRAGPVLANNLRQLTISAKATLQRLRARAWQLQIMALGSQDALAVFGPFFWRAPWVWHLKRWIDLRFMAQLRACAGTLGEHAITGSKPKSPS